MVANEVVTLIHVSMEDQRADIFTKTVSGIVFISHVWFSAV